MNRKRPSKSGEENSESGLYVIGVKSGTALSGDEADLVFTGDDIISFDVFSNVLGGQIFFNKEKLNMIMSRVTLYSELGFFIDDKPVFDPPIRIYHGWALSHDDFDLQFRYDGYTVFLTDAYMMLDSVPAGDRAAKQMEIEANKEKRKKELDVLIKYLSDAGKVVERAEPPEITRTGCDILYFADSINLVNWTINDTRITADYPAGADLSSITPFIIVSEKATIDPPSGTKTDFSNEKEIVYTVTAEDGTVKIFKAQAKEEEEEASKNIESNGKIVGYTKCNDLIGLFIITEKKDALLSFNLPLSCLNADISLLMGGAHNMDGSDISFNYRIAKGEEIKKNFLCPQNAMLPGFTHGPIEDYIQIIINEILP